MIFTIVLFLVFVIAIVAIFAYQKIYNPGRLCDNCYRVLPENSPNCPFCDKKIEW